MLKSYNFLNKTTKIATKVRIFAIQNIQKNFGFQELNLMMFKKNHHCQFYHFSSDNKTPQGDQQKQTKPRASKKQFTEDPEQYSQNSKMTEEGTPQQPKDTPFIPTTFGNYFFGISVVALLLAYGLMQIQFMRADNKKKTSLTGNAKIISKGKAHIGGQWQLTDTNGKPFSNKNLSGSYYLIYFGFTNCPDICPNSLMKLSKALEKVKKMKEAKFYNIQSVFVSVDPDRDTPQKIKKFTEYFDKTMIGVTGKNNEDPLLKECMRKFKIYSSKIQFEDEDAVVKGRKSYTIDHTILTYLMNPENEYVCHIGANLSQHDIAKLMIQKISEDQKQKMKKMKA